MSAVTRRGPRLPDFPWDSLAEAAAVARAHPDGIVDLSVGTPVDSVPAILQETLASAADRPGYPTTHGTAELRQAAVDGLRRRFGIAGLEPEAVFPTIGSKELVAWLPTLLGLGRGDLVAIPELAYPTYEVGALLAGANVVRLGPGEPPPAGTALLWLNSPSNPTGRVSSADELEASVRAARELGAVVASDECYLTLDWDARPVSVLHPTVSGGNFDGLLAVHSLSKSSNLAGYRAGLVTGDSGLVRQLLELRKHAGMMVAHPVQAVITAALRDDDHVQAQRKRYEARRALLRSALEKAGFSVDHSEAGLYLWTTRGDEASHTVEWLAQRGILVAPGTFYGPKGDRHVRIALTASDERVAAAAHRLGG
jgi:succinyldiaminopimelate transaminase